MSIRISSFAYRWLSGSPLFYKEHVTLRSKITRRCSHLRGNIQPDSLFLDQVRESTKSTSAACMRREISVRSLSTAARKMHDAKRSLTVRQMEASETKYAGSTRKDSYSNFNILEIITNI